MNSLKGSLILCGVLLLPASVPSEPAQTAAKAVLVIHGGAGVEARKEMSAELENFADCETSVERPVLRHETDATSTLTTTQSAPEAASGVTVFVWGEAGRSVMPVDLVDSVAALRTAAAELIAVAAAGATTHPCDVRFGREITRVLAAAQAQL